MKDEAGFDICFPDRDDIRRRVGDGMMYDVIMQEDFNVFKRCY